ncbi:MAG: hypothetical protein OXR66_08080 [Candidatus Woesearchaeota archaeon]|nr:hypothetical protein [Candidatus Woesearchaeota archaeon]
MKRKKRKEQRKKENKIRREQFKKRQKNKKRINYIIAIVILAFIGYGLFLFLKPQAALHDDLARCLTQNGATMYGTEWCPHCQQQKRAFGKSFKYVHYVNCDTHGAQCELAGVTGFPTWVFREGEPASGEQTLEYLAERVGCA